MWSTLAVSPKFCGILKNQKLKTSNLPTTVTVKTYSPVTAKFGLLLKTPSPEHYHYLTYFSSHKSPIHKALSLFYITQNSLRRKALSPRVSVKNN